MIGECVEKRSKFNFIMGQLPSELQLEILDYIPRKVIFEPEELAFLQLFYIFTFNNYLEDYSSWFTKVNNFDFIECFDDVLEMAVSAVKYARNFTDDVEFSCEDAGRTPIDNLCRMV